MRKYERGRVSEGPWVFGVAEQGYQKVVVFRVPDRTRETLVKHIITTHILAGPIIYFDKFPQYIPFNQLRYIHLLVQELCWSCTHQYHRRCLGLDQEEVEVDVWYPVCFLGNKWRMSFFFYSRFSDAFSKNLFNRQILRRVTWFANTKFTTRFYNDILSTKKASETELWTGATLQLLCITLLFYV